METARCAGLDTGNPQGGWKVVVHLTDHMGLNLNGSVVALRGPTGTAGTDLNIR